VNKMKRIIAVLSVFLMVAGISLAIEPIGHVSAVQGQAVATGEDGQSRALEIKTPVYAKDKIVTSEGAKVEIQFEDDSVISQGENSEVVLDEYVYSPKDKKNNACSLSMSSGTMRLVTGAIAKLSSDRFSVRTRMATIGIRGCALGFTVDAAQEEVLVIQLHGEDAVTIERRGARGEAPVAPGVQRSVINADHKVVVITQGVMREENLTPDRLAAFINRVRPQGASIGGARRGAKPVVNGAAAAKNPALIKDMIAGKNETETVAIVRDVIKEAIGLGGTAAEVKEAVATISAISIASSGDNAEAVAFALVAAAGSQYTEVAVAAITLAIGTAGNAAKVKQAALAGAGTEDRAIARNAANNPVAVLGDALAGSIVTLVERISGGSFPIGNTPNTPPTSSKTYVGQ
jgi:hypothetical protein